MTGRTEQSCQRQAAPGVPGTNLPREHQEPAAHQSSSFPLRGSLTPASPAAASPMPSSVAQNSARILQAGIHDLEVVHLVNGQQSGHRTGRRFGLDLDLGLPGAL
ncbi:hypothetical protein ACQEVG_24215 [Streptomyces sp. CA-135486]|uniref:hypothetical protein n=1 Tax=Streptomyces sp. CA-135486 TaxID=3240049 RepID=UPI003D8DF8C9